MSSHLAIAHKPANGSCEVRYWQTVDRRGLDECPAKVYAQQVTGLEGKLRSSAMSLAQSPQRRHGNYEAGHWLKGAFAELYEIKVGKHRFACFLRGNVFYVLCGFPKASRKAQARDYRSALKLLEVAQRTFTGDA